jgi:hypothetical protein
MAVDFPTSPSNGQTFTSGTITYTYNATAGLWNSAASGGGGSSVTVSDTAPASPSDGDMWYNSLDLNLYVYYNDGTSSQWVQSAPQQAGVAGADSTVAGPSGPAGGDGRAGVYADMAALIAKTGMVAGDQALVTALNKVFMYTGTAWYLVATMTNDSPTAITGVDGTYTLATDGTSTTITAVSTDPEGFALTWSYAVTTGSLGSTATVSQADNVFTITPSTTEADAGTFSITFSVTDGATGAVSAVSAFTLAFIVTNSRYTALSVKAVAAGSNQTFDDASTTNHTITVAGDTTASTFSPHRHGGYSAYFDGTGDYISAANNADFNVGSSDFTLECWAYIESVNGNAGMLGTYTTTGNQRSYLIYQTDPSSGTNNFGVAMSSDGTWQSGSGFDSGVAVSNYLNQWVHLALTKSGTNATLYLNGNSIGTTSSAPSTLHASTEAFFVGKMNGNNIHTTGYISDVRLVNGSVVYTSNFTPPTAPLTAITNTKFLLGNLPYFKDQSTSNHAITPNGNVSLKPKSVFDNAPYSEASHGASAYFDGTGDYLTLSPQSDFAFGTGDFSVSLWVYFNEAENYDYLIDGRNSGQTTDTWSLSINFTNGAANKLMFASIPSGGSATAVLTSDTDFVTGQWYYISVSRSGTTSRMHFNGTQVAINTSDSTNYSTSPNTSYIGTRYSLQQYFDGYMCDVRVVKGTALSDYTPPTAPLTAITNTKFLLNPETSISDLSQKSEIQCFGDAATSTTQVKFAGTKSIYLDGTGDYLQISNVEDSWISGYTGDFTVELWWYPTNVSNGTYQEILTAGVGFQLYMSPAAGLSLVLSSNNTSSYFLDFWQEHTMTSNTWQHLAVVRNGNVYTLYVDGVSKATTTSSSTFSSGTDPVQLGVYGGTLYPAVGYFQDLRITKGLARYTANFTPPTAELEG